ncbi:caffeine resistance protein [Marssonina coronariae]|uniref:Caffeine resistance protein n=1 Tax=Diplocarpon coronariae TaxID=2795749 RepID=A0A218YTX2_9HELO|nr:hypothetical protein JHW43_001355 [Diplocarpon mali]OWO98029.1 caffeine resistance protein [Marssonina coronariae]
MATSKSPENVVIAGETTDVELAQVSKSTPANTIIAKRSDTDPFLVAFAQPYDAENPLDWPTSRKWLVTDVLSATGFNRIMVSTIMAPALTTIAKELAMSPTEAAMSMSIYLLATAFGPLFIGPLSEIYGRSFVLHSSNVWFLVWNIVCGFAETKGTLIAARFLAGFGASAIYALAGGVLGDLWRPEERGKSTGAYLLIPLLAVAVGPIIGGFIAENSTWRWMFWSTSIFQAAMITVSFFSFQETSGALILRKRAALLRKETGIAAYYTLNSLLDGDRSRLRIISKALTRPIRLLLFHPIIQIQAVIYGFDYGILYIVLSTFSDLWKDRYGQSVEISGLHYIAVSMGELVASQIGGMMMDYLWKRAKRENPAPESRIPLVFPGCVIGSVGMLIYGWTAEYHLHWAVVDVGVFVLLFGLQLGGPPMTGYVIEAYPEHTSSAMAATQFVKSLTAFCFPLFAPTMYNVLGYGWSNSLLALLGLMLGIPLPWWLWKNGARLRAKAGTTY